MTLIHLLTWTRSSRWWSPPCLLPRVILVLTRVKIDLLLFSTLSSLLSSPLLSLFSNTISSLLFYSPSYLLLLLLSSRPSPPLLSFSPLLYSSCFPLSPAPCSPPDARSSTASCRSVWRYAARNMTLCRVPTVTRRTAPSVQSGAFRCSTDAKRKTSELTTDRAIVKTQKPKKVLLGKQPNLIS